MWLVKKTSQHQATARVLGKRVPKNIMVEAKGFVGHHENISGIGGMHMRKAGDNAAAMVAW